MNHKKIFTRHLKEIEVLHSKFKSEWEIVRATCSASESYAKLSTLYSASKKYGWSNSDYIFSKAKLFI